MASVSAFPVAALGRRWSVDVVRLLLMTAMPAPLCVTHCSSDAIDRMCLFGGDAGVSKDTSSAAVSDENEHELSTVLLAT